MAHFKNNKGFAPILIIIIIVALADAGIAGYFAFKKPTPVVAPISLPVPTPANPTSSVDTSNWKTYRNEKYGFELKYPTLYGGCCSTSTYDFALEKLFTFR